MQATRVHTFRVEGMTCDHCIKAVTEAVLARDATADVRVKLQGGEVTVGSSLPSDQLIIAIAEAGYSAGLA
ncbi:MULTISPECIES: heavy-metal-associated domain-containing protein [Pseudomonas]|jgi:copper chaperone|uniref:Heavy-metal-associated domain-containing protein n=1 Tax=Pseudomonas spirodelae TaxID=3101751 RepID=A0ABU5PDX3_9PSED|nr:MULTISPECIES: heavy-metal-associated domain-containing protein [unclassified Pseudomonas]MBU0808051.1 heavy-metal-associated domain-containing protein [Gammaproteobacteria bacterium]MBU0884544.1 heavy-metal-associated domain-containing protein [Gammaproteobacteria bacterium]MBU0901040.1 heavy-metal-associated domain-containing protein [Gammaproteobacteria bacterium]MBU1860146.1 heavy-metal-associated domain-containing protein [Gammaproteobacteria bacterium]MDD2159149.1 heavy-metal-associate